MWLLDLVDDLDHFLGSFFRKFGNFIISNDREPNKNIPNIMWNKFPFSNYTYFQNESSGDVIKDINRTSKPTQLLLWITAYLLKVNIIYYIQLQLFINWSHDILLRWNILSTYIFIGME